MLDRLVETAASLCGADLGHIAIREDLAYRPVATFAMSPELDAVVRKQSFTLDRSTVTGRTALEQRITHIVDMAADPEFAGRETVRVGRLRTALGVPLMRDGEPIGVIGLNRLRVEPFTERQIELVRTFADQAVIAIENTRLLTELRESLEQQQAIAEVLQVINSSPGELQPVFEAMLEKAIRLCEASLGHITSFDGELFHHVATQGEPDLVAFFRQTPALRASSDSITLGRVVRGERFVHIPDCRDTDEYREKPLAREIGDRGRMRTLLTVPLRKEDALLGTIHVYRQQVRPFSDKQIALLQNFAAQAVVAMENARLITETREALEQQTATAAVLQVINSSPGNLTPVFEALLEKAMQLCEAAFGGLTAFDGERFQTLAVRGLPAEAVEVFRQPWVAGPGSYHENLVQGEPLVHTDFGVTDPTRLAHPQSRAIMGIGKARTGLIIALRKDERLLGSLFFYRQEVRPFTDKQIALLQNFAAQAVIAMENARLITETREALEQQTATAEVLGVINSSPGDLAPVFDAMLEKAMRLCEATFGMLRSYDGERFNTLAARGVPEAYSNFLEENPELPGTGTTLARLAEGEPFVHIPDTAG